MIRSTLLASILSSLVLVTAGLCGAEACCGPNRAPEFFRHQHRALHRGRLPGHLHGHHSQGALLGGVRR